jgi:hypothetical protein
MPKGPQGQKRPADVVGAAVHIAKIATGEIDESKSEEKYSLRKKGGHRGGLARAKKLTPEQRHEIAKLAASARWKKPKPI